MRFTTLLSMLISAGLSSCALLATRSTFSPSFKPATGQRIGLTVTRIDYETPAFTKQVDSLFRAELLQELRAGLGLEIIYLGEVSSVLDNVDQLTREGTCDAIMHAELNLKYYGVMRGRERYNAWVRMQLLDLQPRELLGESHFNTLWGKSYGLHPDLSEAIHDATVGAVGPWEKRVQGR